MSLFCLLQINAQSPTISFSQIATYGSAVDIENVGDERLFIVNKLGTIGIIDTLGNVNPNTFLDISSQVTTNGERGLLGLAFHPDYATNGYFYINYTDLSGNTVVSRFSVSALPDIANASSEMVLMTINQPYSNHNGGDLTFGPDGYLYIATGDGGSGGDPDNNGQDLMSLLGKILRIDVDNGTPYSIPADNPFFAPLSAADEIWSYGLRNPWRISFDQLTGDLWIADVGQGVLEEINFQSSTSPGSENYGWRCYEGTATYNNGVGCPSSNGLVFPVYEYGHNSTGGFSVTGGFVYRGNKYPCLYGKYIFVDYVSGNLWTLEADGNGAWIDNFYDDSTFSFPNNISSFGEDSNGELYACKLDGKIYKIEADCDIQANVSLKAYLEGPYIGSGQMLNGLGSLIPLNQPYSQSPYNYSGTESLLSIPSNMVDWVLVEVRAGTPTTSNQRSTVTVETHAGLLLKDGTIVGTNGLPLVFDNLLAGVNYYFCIRHRNHLDVFSPLPTIGSQNMIYDFTLTSNSILMTNQTKQMVDGSYAMYCGDFNIDGSIQTSDFNAWKLSPAVLQTYSFTDANMDGSIQVTDYDKWYVNRAKLGYTEIDF